MELVYPTGLHHFKGEQLTVDLRGALLKVDIKSRRRNHWHFFVEVTETNSNRTTRKFAYPAFRCEPTQEWSYFQHQKTLVITYSGCVYLVVRLAHTNVHELRFSVERIYSTGYQQRVNHIKAIDHMITARPESATASPDPESETAITCPNPEPNISDWQKVLFNESYSDFTITCSDEQSFPVHRAILGTFWPSFGTIMSEDNVSRDTLSLEYPSRWVQPMISFIYRQKMDVDFEQATGALIVARKCQFKELNVVLTAKIKTLVTPETSLEDLCLGWERSGSNEELVLYFARKIAKHGEVKSLFNTWNTDRLVDLYGDTAKLVE